MLNLPFVDDNDPGPDLFIKVPIYEVKLGGAEHPGFKDNGKGVHQSTTSVTLSKVVEQSFE